jgi:hypothetical protein
MGRCVLFSPLTCIHAHAGCGRHTQLQSKTEWPVRIKDELIATTSHLLGLEKLELFLFLKIIESSDKDDDDDGPEDGKAWV